ncbi:MAG: hypothetical protein NT166_12805 [Candidatus Aminicenantes bacterium]|nr:hypothetical protein [Candidatus Aminicenantes bacterium]
MNEQKNELTKSDNGQTVSTDEVPDAEKPTKHVRQTFERQFNEIRDIIDLSLNDTTLKNYAGQYGYGAERIGEGKILFDETDTLYENQKSAIEAQKAATYLLQGKKIKADAMAKRFWDIARVAFKSDPITYKALGLNSARKQAFGEWLAQNKYFYNKLLSMPDALVEIAKYTVTQAELEEGKQALLDAAAAETAQQNAIAEAQNATELKNKAFQKLKRWIKKYLNVMKEALENVPQMKEKLGIVTPIEV